MDQSSDPFDTLQGSSPPDIDLMDSEERIDYGPYSGKAPSLPRSNPSSLLRPTPAPFTSSDPLVDPLLPAEISATLHRLPNKQSLNQNQKRGPPESSSGSNHSNKAPRLFNSIPTTAKIAILQARDLIVQAYTLTTSRDEQSKLLDLIEVFREFTEKGRIQNASSILASQVTNLETATRQIETKTRALVSARTSEPTRIPQITLTPSTSTSSFATIASKGAKASTIAQEWTIVGQKAPTTTKEVVEKPTRQTKDRSNRLILVKTLIGPNSSFSPLAIRNEFNKAFTEKGIKGPVVTSVTKSLGQNIVVTTASPFTADFLLEKKAIWQHLIAFKSAQKDEPWYKVVLHGVPIADFNNPEGMELVKEELVTFNKGYKPIGTPYWLTSAEKRMSQRGGSVVVAFATETEANRAIHNRLFIAGISVRVEKLYSTAPTTQCSKCQTYGHLDSYCRKPPTCRLCSESHATIQHYCSICKTKGSKCPHLVPKCANCKGPHMSNHKTCEILLAIKNKTKNTTL